MVINTNTLANSALASLASTQSQISVTMTRLQTGLKINSAADDPSGLIASEGMRAQIDSMGQALQNSQATLNYAKTAEGGLSEISSQLVKARTLAVANGNGTLTDVQKATNQTQINNIFASITRTAKTTQYGTKNLLDGSAGVRADVSRSDLVSSANFGSTFGAGAVQAGAITVDVTTEATRGVSSATGAATGSAAGDALGVDGTFVVNGKSFSYLATDKFSDVVDKINLSSSDTGVTAEWDTDHVKLTNVAYGSVAMNVTDTGGALKATAGALGVTAGVDAVATVTVNGVSANFNAGKGLDLKDANGNRLNLMAAANVAAGPAVTVGAVALGSTQFQIGANAGQTASLVLGKFDADALGFTGGTVDIMGSDMSAALNKIDSAIATVSGARAEIGSFMENTISSNSRAITISRQNLQSTRSALADADMAAEMTGLTRLQILVQSGTAMLGQASQAPQSVLSLLR